MYDNIYVQGREERQTKSLIGKENIMDLLKMDMLISKLKAEKDYLESCIAWMENPNNDIDTEDVKKEKLHNAKVQRFEMRKILSYMGIDYKEL